jgi:hypothetical protein
VLLAATQRSRGQAAVATFVFIEDGLRNRARMASRSLAKGTTSEIDVVPQVVPRSAAESAAASGQPTMIF